MNPQRADVLVVGGGVIGLACALLLLRAGRGVTVIERGTVGKGSSHGNCGTITPSHLPLPSPATLVKGLKWMLKPDAPLRIRPTLDPAVLGWLLSFAQRCNTADYERTAAVKMKLMLASRKRLAELIRDEHLECEFVESGTLSVYRTTAAFDQATAEAELLRRLGVPVEILDGAAARRREPALKDSIVGAHLHSGDARLRPNLLVAELARAVRAAGGRIEENTEVRGFGLQAGRIDGIDTTRGRFSGSEIVYALGAWSPLLGRQIGLRLPIQPGKGYSITYSRPSRTPSIPLVLKERGVCVTAWASGYRLGSTMEFAGYDTTLNRTRLDALKRGAAEYLLEPVGPAVEEEWYGWRPMTPDDMPIIGRAPALSNLTLATGHGMLGVSLSAITAQLVCELLTNCEPSLDLQSCAVARFG